MIWVVQFFIMALGALATLLIQQLRTREIALLWTAVAGYTAVHVVLRNISISNTHNAISMHYGWALTKHVREEPLPRLAGAIRI